MAALQEITAAAKAAARKALSPTEVVAVQVSDAVGADGEDLLRITIVVPDGKFDDIDGTHFLSVLLNLQDRLRDAGEERRAVVGYATPAELADDGDPES